jgi:DnaJ-class molecular chaperone
MTLEQAYSILGVPLNSDLAEAQKAFKKLALKYHPDRPGGSEDRMKEINNAMNVIKNPSMADEAPYKDSYRDSYKDDYKSSTNKTKSSYNKEAFEEKINDFFDSYYSRNSSSKKEPKLSEDEPYRIKITEEDIKTGVVHRQVVGPANCGSQVYCPFCSGTGRKISKEEAHSYTGMQYRLKVIPCPNCKGSGVSKSGCKYCREGKPHQEKYKFTYSFLEVSETIGSVVHLETTNSQNRTVKRLIMFQVEENPISIYLKVPLKDIESKIREDMKVSFNFLGVPNKYKISDILKGKVYKVVGAVKVYIRIYFT